LQKKASLHYFQSPLPYTFEDLLSQELCVASY